MKTEFNKDFEIKPLLNKVQIRIEQVNSSLEELFEEVDTEIYSEEVYR